MKQSQPSARETDPGEVLGVPSAGGHFGRKTLIVAVAGAALVLLAGGGLYAMWSHRSAALGASEEAGADAAAEPSASKKSRHGDSRHKASAKHEKSASKEGKSKHGSKDEKKKKGEKKEGKTAHAKKPAGEAKHAGKESKGAKAHAKPEGEAKAGTASKPCKKTEADAKLAREKCQLDAVGREKPQEEEADKEKTDEAEQPAYLGEGRARLGRFSIRIYDPLTRTMLRTDFDLEGLITCEDEAEFQRFLRSRAQFFREQVMVAMRTSDAVDFTDPSLALVKRRMIARVNRSLGSPFLKSVEIKGFVVYESVDNSPYVRWQPAAGSP